MGAATPLDDSTAPPHVLLFPFPAQGHVTPMLHLAHLLHYHSGPTLHITFLNTQHIHRLLLLHNPSSAIAPSLRFRFRTISDGLLDDDPRPFLGLLDLESSMRERCREEYREELLRSEGDGWPAASCVVADGLLRVGLEVAEEVGVPAMVFRTSSACSVWAYCCIPRLIQSKEIPFRDEDDMDKSVHSIAGMESILRRRDLPRFIRQAKSTNDPIIQFEISNFTNLTRGVALILNTFESIEALALSQIRSVHPTTYTLGSLQSLVRNTHSHNIIPSENAQIGASLWKEDHTCLKWLDSQPPKSVVYVSFGSITVLSEDELLEFWHGLVNSGHGFLWVVRPDLLRGGSTDSTRAPPTELEKATKERGCLVPWAPQEKVLAHPAIGCFLTHSGWNSTLESIVAGVPMICWPFYGDQQINSRFVSEVWKIGVDIKDMHGRGIVEKMVREVMVGEGADELRKAASETAGMAVESISKQGSSFQNLERLIQHIKILKRKQ